MSDPAATRARTEYRRFVGSTGALKGYAGYEVLDPAGRRIGSTEELFRNAGGGPEYVRVPIGLLFKRATLVPVQDVAPDPAARSLTLK